jgi:NhaA family Na+:H+ antiporter
LALRPTLEFLKTEAGGGAALVVAAAAAMIVANSPWAHVYFASINAPFEVTFGAFSETLSVQAWIKDALMAVFFFVVGLEIKQEVLKGELSSPRKVALPMAAAAGGMVAPILVFLAVSHGAAPGQGLWAAPAATDIAFALAALALVGRGLPDSLRLFLLVLAISDDMGAVGLIATVFTHKIHGWPLAGAAASLAGLMALSQWKNAPLLLRVIGFLMLGAFTLTSGINTSVAGVAAAFTVPIGARTPGQEPVLRDYMYNLHPYVAYGILPLFAFTSAGVSLAGFSPARLLDPAPLGLILGLFLGKQIGVVLVTLIAIRLGLARRPTGATWLELYGVSLLCGIGFTMSLFIAGLALADHGGPAQAQATLGVMLGSLLSAGAGIGVLSFAGRLRARQRWGQGAG